VVAVSALAPIATRRSRGPGLAGRLALQLFVLAVLVTAGAGTLSFFLLRSAFEQRLEEELRRMHGRVTLGLEELDRELGASLTEIDEHLRRRDPALLERLLRGDPEVADAAVDLLPLANLDWLELVEPGGAILSSAPWRERAGLELGASREAFPPAERATLRRLADASGGRLGLVRSRFVGVGSRELVIVAGRLLEVGFLQRVAGTEAALLFDGAGGAPLVAPPTARLDAGRAADALGQAVDDDRIFRLTDLDGHRWDAMVYPLAGATGAELGAIVVAVDHGRIASVLARMRNGFLVLGGVAGLVAALIGLWIARGVSRPVRELVRAFDAVAAGEADYDFPASRQDELQELVASVSRLHRALEVHRQRSTAAERVATWRDVARHVAHEVKNPLVPIRLTVENLVRARQRAPERFDSLFDEGMRTILEEVDQLRRMVEEFSAFARLPLPVREPRDLEALLDSVLDLFGSVPGVEISRRYGGGLSGVPLDSDQVSRALKNVVGNAVEILGERGAGTGESPRIEVRTAVEDDMARIDIEDNGPGFSEEAARSVFDPYFTTRSGGTGLGMALTYRIVTEHGGVITASNRERGGARVTIRLPLRLEDHAGETGPGEHEGVRG
jgi:signal transduction histidine kinase